ncbi:nucleotide-binding protein [Streptomyces murinus]|uniref:nucleotide-binding protein n=1 Tax=Streptomyces murinus TaxID=33900 RepID=UPI0037FDAC9D
MSTERQAVRLRRHYTGESHQAALSFFRRHGMHFGLVPDTHDPQQQVFEAAVLRTLARPHPALGPLHTPDAMLAVTAASPGVESLVLWPQPDHLTDFLLHLLPTRAADGIAGVPALRAATGPYQDLVVRLLGRSAQITVRATGADVERARTAAQEAGREPLWDQKAAAVGERRSWDALVDSFAPDEIALWSRALRRPALAETSAPGLWAQRAPSTAELTGPKPQQLLPRPVGPLAGSVRGTVAVTPATNGGVGCSTVALQLAAALARGGARVALLADAHDPNSPLGRQDERDESGPWQPVAAGLPTLRGAALPEGRQEARDLVALARAQVDMVLIDTGNGAYPHQHLTQEADLVLAVTRYDQRHWIADTETVDRRPEHVQMWAWLDQQYLQRRPRRELTPERLLLDFLDVVFADWVFLRTWDDEAVGPDWEPDWDLLAELEEEELDARDIETLPAEDEEPDLDQWRTEFLAAVDAEGARRHPALWPQVSAAWPARNRRRNRAGLLPTQPEAAEQEAQCWALLELVESEAVARWGADLWRAHRRQWAAPAAGDLPLLKPYEDLIEHINIPRPGPDVADLLLRDVHRLPADRVMVTLNRVRGDIEPQQLADVNRILRERGARGVAFVPYLSELAEASRDTSALTDGGRPQDAAAARLAVAVTDQLTAVRSAGHH